MKSETTSTGSGRRLRALIRKEFLQIVRDPSSIAIAFLLPVVMLLIFGYGVSLDAKNVPLGIVVENPGPVTESLVSSFRQSEYFKPVILPGMRQADAALWKGDIQAIVRLKGDFAADLLRSRPAQAQVILNGVDSNYARLVSGYIQGAVSTWILNRAGLQRMPANPPVNAQPRIWFNSELRSRNFLVPGLIAVIMTLTGALLTAMVMAREWERGTMEAILVTPVLVREVILGKVIPYFILGMGGMALSFVMALVLFDVPFRGSVLVLTGASALFLLVALGMGLLISSAARDQFVAGQIAMVTTFLPAFILSGFLFDIAGMPEPVRVVTHFIAARYFVSILQTVFLAGDVWSVIIPNALTLLLMAVIFLGLSRRMTRKRLE